MKSTPVNCAAIMRLTALPPPPPTEGGPIPEEVRRHLCGLNPSAVTIRSTTSNPASARRVSATA